MKLMNIEMILFIEQEIQTSNKNIYRKRITRINCVDLWNIELLKMVKKNIRDIFMTNFIIVLSSKYCAGGKLMKEKGSYFGCTCNL